MSVLYDFPRKAAFGRVLPKSRIYEHASLSPAVRDLFVREVDKIIWSYKLSPETINLPAKGYVQEIQIFTIALKTGTLKHEVLRAVDRAVPSPIFFALSFQHKIRYIAAFKRPNEADPGRRVVSGYFETDWVPDDAEKAALPVVIDLGALYHGMLRQIIPLSLRPGETMDELVSRVETLRFKERKAVQTEARLRKEKQFNRRVKINAVLRTLKQEIEALKV